MTSGRASRRSNEDRMRCSVPVCDCPLTLKSRCRLSRTDRTLSGPFEPAKRSRPREGLLQAVHGRDRISGGESTVTRATRERT